jgi:ATP-dependent Clp protease protease subunit
VWFAVVTGVRAAGATNRFVTRPSRLACQGRPGNADLVPARLPIISRDRAGSEASAMPSVPFVIERDGREERVYDVYSRLLKDRIVFFQGEVDDDSAAVIVAQMFYLQLEDPKADIHLFINSPGGSVTAGMSVYDTMRFLTCDVATYCIGMAASMGATLLAAGAKGKRHALPHAEVMIHQVIGGARGAATDIAIRTAHLLRTKKTMNELLAKMTGQPLERIEKDTDRDNFMSAQEAKEYGLIDHVIERMPAGLVSGRTPPLG